MVTLNGRKIGDTLGIFTCHQYNESKHSRPSHYFMGSVSQNSTFQSQ